MPYKFETDKIRYNKVPWLDGRIKVNEEQKKKLKCYMNNEAHTHL